MKKKETRPRCYISGKISGLGYARRDANFARARRRVFEMGYTPVSPYPSILPAWMPWLCHMIVDIAVMMTCRSIAAMPNWDRSRGARIELRLARVMHKEIILLISELY